METIITKEIQIDMGHRVPNHEGKCYNLHGHRYKIIAGVNGKVIDEKGNPSEGMVIDFTDLKNILVEVVDKKLDHAFMLYKEDKFFEDFKPFVEKMKFVIVDFVPTAENIARYLYEQMEGKLKEKGIKLVFVEVYETPTSVARYTL